MSAPATVSSAYIAGQQAELAVTLADLELRAEALAFAAVSGDTEAVQQLDEINAQVERARADGLVLARAKATADRLEAEAAAAARLVRQAEHRAEAARQAVAFVDLVERADATIDEFVSLIQQISSAEVALRREVRSAGLDPDEGSMVGRSGAVGLLRDRLHTATGQHRYLDSPPVVGRVRRAWAFLHDDGEARHG